MASRKQHRALYPGTFDGLTNGHLDIIRRASELFDSLTVAVARNEAKSPVFTLEERLWMLKEETKGLSNVEATAFEGLTVGYASKIGASCIVRGIRVVSDFEYELQMAQMNRALNPVVETIFMFPSTENLYISTSQIKEVLALGADVHRFVPASTAKLLQERLGLARSGGIA